MTMARKDVSLRVGGAAGDGVASAGETFAKLCSRSGLQVDAYSSYQSLIRGGHVWFQIRASPEHLHSPGDGTDIVIALNQETVDYHRQFIQKGGGVIHDDQKVKVPKEFEGEGRRDFAMPLIETAKKFSKDTILANTVALGGACALFRIPMDPLATMLKAQFGRKGEEVVNANIGAATTGYEFSKAHFTPLDRELTLGGAARPLLTGNQALGLGAVAAGCKFLSQYPMTPASGVMHWIAAVASKYGVVFKQCEDELAAINMAIGASFAGVRSMTGTSGGGFSLMVEGFGLAAMTETPLVVVECQRGGPSTGLPTRTSQGDLNMFLGASQDDFPRAIFGPRNVRECVSIMGTAFNVAERYQIPVIVASDYYQSEHYQTVDDMPLHPPIDRGAIQGPLPPGTAYKRYLDTADGVSPRSFPGTAGATHIAASDEHDEAGNLISDWFCGVPWAVEARKKLMEKRMRKLEYLRKEMPRPEWYGPASADLTLINWGSTQGAVREAVDRINADGFGFTVNALEFVGIFPLPTDDVTKALHACTRSMVVEATYTGQFARYLRADTGIKADHLFGKYDGEIFEPWEIMAKAKEAMSK